METAAMVSRQYEPRVAKRIYLHVNGRDNERPKMVVINDRHVRDFTTLLNRVTSGIKAPVAVRNIYTPCGGSKVISLQSIENGKHYVAGGAEQYKKLKYPRLIQTRVPVGRELNKLSPAKAIQAVSRFRNLPEKPYLIHVFRNGDTVYQGARVLLTRRTMTSLENVLELVTEKIELTLPAKKLYTLDGQMIHTVTDIRDGEKYVVIEGARKFIKLPYTAMNSTFKNTRYPRARRLKQQVTLTSEGNSTLGGTYTFPTSVPPDKPRQIKRLMPAKQHKGKNRPFAGRKDMEARNLALSDARADSVFGGSPSPAIAKEITKCVSPSEQQDNTSPFGTLESSTDEIPPMETSLEGVVPLEEPPDHEKTAPEGEASTAQLSPPISPEGQRRPCDESSLNPCEKERETPSITKPLKEEEKEIADEVPETEDVVVEKPIDQQEAVEITEESLHTAADDNYEQLTNQHNTTAIELHSETNQQSVDLSIARVPQTESVQSKSDSKPSSRLESQRNTPIAISSTSQLQTESSQV